MMEKMDKKSPLAMLERACETIGVDNSVAATPTGPNGNKSALHSGGGGATMDAATPTHAMNGVTKKLSKSSGQHHSHQKINGHHQHQMNNVNGISNRHSPAQDGPAVNGYSHFADKNAKKDGHNNNGNNGSNNNAQQQRKISRMPPVVMPNNGMNMALSCEPSTSSPSTVYPTANSAFGAAFSNANLKPNASPFSPITPNGAQAYPLNLMMAMAASYGASAGAANGTAASVAGTNNMPPQMMLPASAAAMMQQQLTQQQGKSTPQQTQTSITASASAAPISSTQQQQQQQQQASTPPAQNGAAKRTPNAPNGVVIPTSTAALNGMGLQFNAQLAALVAAASAGGFNVPFSGMDELNSAAYAQQQQMAMLQYAAAATSATNAVPTSVNETFAAAAAAGFLPNPLLMMGNNSGLDAFSNLNSTEGVNSFQAMLMAAACGQHPRHVCTYQSSKSGQLCGKMFENEDELFSHIKAHILQNGGQIPPTMPKDSQPTTPKMNGGGKIKSGTKQQISPQQQQLSMMGTPIPAHFPQQQQQQQQQQTPNTAMTNGLRYAPYTKTTPQQQQQQQQQIQQHQQQQAIAAAMQMQVQAIHQAQQQQHHQQQQQQQQNQKHQQSQQQMQQSQQAANNQILAMQAQYEQYLMSAAAAASGAGQLPPQLPFSSAMLPPQFLSQHSGQQPHLTAQQQQQMLQQQQILLQQHQQQHMAAAIAAAAAAEKSATA